MPQREEQQGQDRREVGHRREQLRRHAELGRLGVELQHRRGAEDVGADSTQPGRQAAKTTSARAIQPRPAVMPGDQKRV